MNPLPGVPGAKRARGQGCKGPLTCSTVRTLPFSDGQAQTHSRSLFVIRRSRRAGPSLPESSPQPPHRAPLLLHRVRGMAEGPFGLGMRGPPGRTTSAAQGQHWRTPSAGQPGAGKPSSAGLFAALPLSWIGGHTWHSFWPAAQHQARGKDPVCSAAPWN